jgi:hypothetical protein
MRVVSFTQLYPTPGKKPVVPLDKKLLLRGSDWTLWIIEKKLALKEIESRPPIP